MRGHRKVEGLTKAEFFPGRPAFIPHSRPRKGCKIEGIRYEESVARALEPAGAKHGLWWKYCDAKGEGFCQTDLVFFGKSNVLVLECKLTWRKDAWDQLKRLYVPVLELATQRAALPVLVCKNLTHEVGDVVCHRVEEALEVVKAGGCAVLHWKPGGLPPYSRGFAPRRELPVGTGQGPA